MSDSQSPDTVKERLTRALRAKAILTERSKQLQQQLEDFRSREETMAHVASELLERQRELNFMLHRASSVLHQLQDTNLALSAEFTQITKELPAPESADWDKTISKVNDLFQKTHELAGEMQEEIFRTTSESGIPKAPTSQADEKTASQQTSTPNPEVQESEVQPEDSHEIPQTSDAEFHHTEEEAAEPQAEQVEAIEAEETVSAAEEEDDPVERLFRNIDCDEDGRIKSPVGGASDDEKQGLLSRLFARRKSD